MSTTKFFWRWHYKIYGNNRRKESVRNAKEYFQNVVFINSGGIRRYSL